MINIKFIFHLKNGKTFECIEEMNVFKVSRIIETCTQCLAEGKEGVICFSDSIIRLSEVAIVEWEEM